MVPIGNWDYDDAINTWGTKWDISLTDANLELETINDTTSAIVGYCESAWGPPDEACITYMANNPDVDIKLQFHEGGNDFCGTLETGEMSISEQSRDFWDDDELGQELNERFAITDYLDEEQESIEGESLDDEFLVDPETEPHA